MKLYFAVRFTTTATDPDFMLINLDTNHYAGNTVVAIDPADEGNIYRLLEAALNDQFNAEIRGFDRFIIDSFVECDERGIPLTSARNAGPRDC